MVDVANIRDWKTFQAWLEETGQPREVCVALAVRATARVLPMVWESAASLGRFSVLPFLRANLIASIAGLAPPGVVTDLEHTGILRANAAAYAANVSAYAANAAAFARS